MKVFNLILFLLLTQSIWSQVIFKSPITQYGNFAELETINRTITISSESITVESETPINTIKEEVFYIKEFTQHEFPQHGLSDFFVCTSKGGLITTYFLIPVKDKIEFILAIQPSQYNQDSNVYRFLVN